MTSTFRFQARGFTLIELMVSIGLATLVVVVAYSGFRAATQAMRLSAQMTVRNSILSSYFARACDLADNWTAMDPSGAAAGANFRVERAGTGATGTNMSLPPTWPQPSLLLKTIREPGAVHQCVAVDCSQLDLSHWSMSSMIPNWIFPVTGAWFPMTPFGRDKPNVDANNYLLATMDPTLPDYRYRTAWFGDTDVSPGVNGLWWGQGIGRKQTQRKTNSCTIELTDPESGSVQSLSFQMLAADQWVN